MERTAGIKLLCWCTLISVLSVFSCWMSDSWLVWLQIPILVYVVALLLGDLWAHWRDSRRPQSDEWGPDEWFEEVETDFEPDVATPETWPEWTSNCPPYFGFDPAMKSWPIGKPTPEADFARRHIPQEKFVEYEPRDLEWMIPLGMAPLIEIRMHLPVYRFEAKDLAGPPALTLERLIPMRRIVANSLEAKLLNGRSSFSSFGVSNAFWLPGQD